MTHPLPFAGPHEKEIRIARPVQTEVEPNSYSTETAWVKKHVERSRYEHAVQLGVQVTPALAHALLAINTRNRSINKHKLKSICEAIERGEWKAAHQGIAINWHGVLHDGQHRLLAVIETGTPCIMDIHFGIDPDTYDRIDCGWTRTIANTLEVAGIKNAKLVGSMVRVVSAIDRGVSWSTGGNSTSFISRHGVLELVEARNDLLPSSDIALGIKSSMKRVPSLPGIGAGIFLIRRRMGPFEPAEFFENVRTGLKVKGEDDPVYRLRQRITGGDQIEGVEMAALVVKAYNNMLDGKPTRLLRWSRSESFPEVAG